MKRRKFIAVDGRGVTHVRTSNSRVYTRAVAIHFKGYTWKHPSEFWGWADVNFRPARTRVEWAGNACLAEKNARGWHRDDIEAIEILRAEEVLK